MPTLSCVPSIPGIVMRFIFVFLAFLPSTRAALVFLPGVQTCPNTTDQLASIMVALQQPSPTAFVQYPVPVTALSGPATGACYLSYAASATGLWTRGDCSTNSKNVTSLRITNYLSQATCLNKTKPSLNTTIVADGSCSYVPALQALAFGACGDTNDTLAQPAFLPPGSNIQYAPMDAFGGLMQDNASISCAPLNPFTQGGILGENNFWAAGGEWPKCVAYSTWSALNCNDDGTGQWIQCSTVYTPAHCTDDFACAGPNYVLVPFDQKPCQVLYSGLFALAPSCTGAVTNAAFAPAALSFAALASSLMAILLALG